MIRSASQPIPRGNFAGSPVSSPLAVRCAAIHPSSRLTQLYPAAASPELTSSSACLTTADSVMLVRNWYQVL